MVSSRGPLAARSHPTRVLVADDDDDYRLGLRALLEKAGFDVVEATNGAVALELCRSANPAIVLLDVIMPVMSGAEFLRAKQADSRIMYIPVVVISTTDISVSARVVRHLRKPVAPDVLLSIIRVVVGAARPAAP
jgi:Response regulator containing CheY-like receiver, AAA-type ATPase, and DNA-binding domains